jgi:glycosyltransferase involved in cell wall biosynthesis
LRVLHLIYDHVGNPWVGGGGGVRTLEFYRRLARKGHEITVVCGRYPGAQDYQEEEGRLKFHFVGTGRDNYVLSTFCYALKAMGYLRRHARRADVVVEDFAPWNPLFSFLLARTPVVIQLQSREGINILRRYFLLGIPFWILAVLYPRVFRHKICLSEAMAGKLGLRDAQIIPNGVDASLLRNPVNGRGYGVFLGRLHAYTKGLDVLLQALKMVPDLRLKVGGTGSDLRKLQDLARHLGIAKRVEFLGFVSGKAKEELLGGADFIALPSRFEGQPLSLLEAAACGKPAVVSDLPELAFAVQAGFALPAKVGDAKDLAEKINLLLKDAQLRRKMGQRAREFARDFTWDALAERYEEFLLRLCGGGR